MKVKPLWALVVSGVMLAAPLPSPYVAALTSTFAIRCITFSYLQICVDLARLHPHRAGNKALFDIPAAERSIRQAVYTELGVALALPLFIKRSFASK